MTYNSKDRLIFPKGQIFFVQVTRKTWSKMKKPEYYIPHDSQSQEPEVKNLHGYSLTPPTKGLMFYTNS